MQHLHGVSNVRKAIIKVVDVQQYVWKIYVDAQVINMHGLCFIHFIVKQYVIVDLHSVF